ncbi:hypothetical protein L227DRAFT_605668 [Lentinus tigrinus ALCF2SS1-6]|uniref:Uncharacterized protein n=2 Tax=Lentinus tigrinus TaxID=5365 RepID=A0A5C2SVH6_9APHY|nr:hypothetical protein L227DRAFT_605668 [Lentinus tigrinus ALCF2SS1-6]
MPQPQAMGQLQHVALQQASTNNLTGAVQGPPSSGRVGSHPSDEKVLIDALKKGRAGGLNPCRALEKLHKVNGHTEMEWKNYFLEHLERFYPTTNERRVESSRQHVSIHAHSSSGVQESVSRLHSTPSGSTSTSGKARDTSSRRARTPDHLPRSPLKTSLSRRPPTSTSSNAACHGPSLSELISQHAGMKAPLLPPSVKPKPPQKPATTQESGRIGKFTNEEKIFFIQFLRWRLERDGPTPDKFKLCRALSREAPHRSADAWRRHWETDPQLAEAMLRVAGARHRAAAGTFAQNQSGEHAALDYCDDEGEEEYEGEEDDTEEEGSDAYVPADDSEVESRPRKKVVRPTCLKVTEDDIRDLARYKLERRDGWDETMTNRARWGDFTSKNTKRSFWAWVQVVASRAKEIDQAMEELLVEQEVERQDFAEPAHASPRPPDTASSSSSMRTDSVNAVDGATGVPQKRDADSRLAVRSGSPASKRVKQEPVVSVICLDD